MWHLNDSADFDDPNMRRFGKNDCSPVVDHADFRGLLLNAPQRIEFRPGQRVPGSPAFAMIRVCGMCRLDYHFMGLDGQFIEKILLVAVDDDTNQTYSGRMRLVNNPVARPPDLAGRDRVQVDYSGLIIEQYFNPNLVEVLGLPPKPARYVVYATLGEYRSNTVRVEVAEAK